MCISYTTCHLAHILQAEHTYLYLVYLRYLLFAGVHSKYCVRAKVESNMLKIENVVHTHRHEKLTLVVCKVRTRTYGLRWLKVIVQYVPEAMCNCMRDFAYMEIWKRMHSTDCSIVSAVSDTR